MTTPMAIACRPVSLPDHLIWSVARLAIQINPANAPAFVTLGAGIPIEPSRLAGLTTSFWRPGDTITWAFVDGANAAVRRLMTASFARWTRHADLTIVESGTDPICRITREPSKGHWSYIGTGNRLVPAGQPTMNLAGFTEATPTAEWERTADHEAGHLLGLTHGQKTKWLTDRLDPAGCYARFGGPPNGWPRSLVDSEILRPDPMADLTDFGPEDLDRSVMTYGFPADCTRDRIPIPGGAGITKKDAQDIGRIYGRPDVDPPDDPKDPPVVLPPPVIDAPRLAWGVSRTFAPRTGLPVRIRLPVIDRQRKLWIRVQDDTAAAVPLVQIAAAGESLVPLPMAPGPSRGVMRCQIKVDAGDYVLSIAFEGVLPGSFQVSASKV